MLTVYNIDLVVYALTLTLMLY